MTLDEYRRISKALNAELEATFKKYGLKLNRATARIDPYEGTVGVTIKLQDANLKDKDGNATTADAERFKKLCGLYGMTADALGLVMTVQGRKYEVVGMKDGRAEKNVLGKRDDGKVFVFKPSFVVRYVMEAAKKMGG